MTHTTTRIKFCGITRRVDALTAVALGVDALGFVFYRASGRWITPAAARAIIAELPPFVCTVGLFVDESPATIVEVAAATGIQVVQFHGNETAAVCALSPRPYVKAIRMARDLALEAVAESFAGASALLFDSYDPTRFGGTGRVFDWSLLPIQRQKSIILAGGLNAGNVAAAITQVRPYAVDVSGGIESGPGIKDAEKMRAFVAEVRRIERESTTE